MKKHMFDSPRIRNGAARFLQYARIDATERPQPQTKILQKRPQHTDPQTRARRFLSIDRQQG